MALTKLEAASGLHISLSWPSTSRYRLDYLSNCPDEYQIVNEDIHDHRRACRPTWRWILLFRDGCWVEKLKFRSMLGSSFTNFEKASWNLAKVRTLLGSIQLPSVARTIYMVDIGSRITVSLSRPTVCAAVKWLRNKGLSVPSCALQGHHWLLWPNSRRTGTVGKGAVHLAAWVAVPWERTRKHLSHDRILAKSG